VNPEKEKGKAAVGRICLLCRYWSWPVGCAWRKYRSNFVLDCRPSSAQVPNRSLRNGLRWFNSGLYARKFIGLHRRMHASCARSLSRACSSGSFNERTTIACCLKLVQAAAADEKPLSPSQIAKLEYFRAPICIGWQWRNVVPYLCQLVFATILWVKLLEMFVTLLSLEYALSVG